MSPLNLSQTCLQYVQGLSLDDRFEHLKCKYPLMPEISIDLNGVLKLLPNLKPDKAAEPDEINPVVLKELRHEIAPIICLLLERALSTGVRLSDWTKARVSPLFKKADKGDTVNYRQYRSPAYFARLWSISLHPTLPGTSIITKFCMSCSMVSVKSAHVKHSSYSLLRTCPDNLFKVSRLTRLLDFSKAFDKVSHFKLLFKVSQHGNRGHTLTESHSW